MSIVNVDLIPAVFNGRPVFPLSFQTGTGAEDTLLTAVIPVGTAANPAPGGINQGDLAGSVYRIWKDVPAQMRPVELTVQNNFVDATLNMDFGIYGANSPIDSTTTVLDIDALATNLTFAAERTQSTPLILVGPNPITKMGLSLREMIPQDLFQNPPFGQTNGGYDLALTMMVAPTALPPFDSTLIPFTGPGPLPLVAPNLPTTITGISQAADAVVTDVAHGYTTGQMIYIEGVLGMTQVNGRYYIVEVVNANSYTLDTVAGAEVDSTGYGAYTSGGTATRVNNFIVVTLEMIRIC